MSLNFANITAPTAGGQAAAGTGSAGLLSGTPLGGSGLLGGGAAQPGVDLFTLLLGQGKTPALQENFAATGKNLPQVPVSKEEINTTDKAIDALQAVLTGLVVQQQTIPNASPVQPQVTNEAAQIISGSETSDTLLGGAMAAQAFTTTNSGVASGFTDTLQPAVAEDVSALQPVITPVVTNKTLDAYRSAANLTLPVAGANLNTVDQQAIEAVSALPQLPTLQNSNPSKSNDAAVSLLQSAEQSPDTLVESITRLKNLSAMTPLPATENGKPQVGTTETGNAPLDQLAKLQSALTPVKTEAVAAKTEVASASASVTKAETTITPNAVAQAATGQKLQQNLGQKKPLVSEINAAADKQAQADASLTQSSNNVNVGLQQPGGVKPVTHDFVSHLQRSAVASPAEQVAMQIAKLPSGKQNITVQLDPADLGKVDVKLEWGAEGKAQITISAERRETLEMLKGDASSLQRSLGDSGIKADAGSLQFSLKGQENFAGQLSGESQGQRKSGTENAMNDNEIKQAVETASIAARYVNLNNLLDLKV